MEWSDIPKYVVALIIALFIANQLNDFVSEMLNREEDLV